MTDRLADETAEEREARLRKMTASNHAILAAETAEERESTGEAQTTTGYDYFVIYPYNNRSCRHSSHCY